jgi:uncharacterized iron-regulated protein
MKTNSNPMMLGRRVVVLASWLLIVAAGGTAAAVSDPSRISAIVVKPENSATLPELMTNLRSERLIYVGETHTSFADHLVQLSVLRSMASRPEGLALGVEWFQKKFQPVLDDYLAGRIDEAEMLRRTEYFDRWRFDWRLYRPIVQFAKDKGIPIIALNASAELTSAIGRQGINSLPKALREELPDSYDVSDKAYEAALREVYLAHSRGNDEAGFQRFTEVQLTWDETMAQSVSEYLDNNPGGRMLVLAGKGHIGGRSGIPNRVTRRTGIEGVTLVSYDPNASLFASADFLVLVEQQRLPPRGMMRVLLETGEDGVFIKGFSPQSPAESAGMEAGDRLVAINGTPIRHYTDVKIAMIDQLPGNEVEVTLERSGLLGSDRELSIQFELAGEG